MQLYFCKALRDTQRKQHKLQGSNKHGKCYFRIPYQARLRLWVPGCPYLQKEKKKCVHIISISIHPLIQHVTLCIHAGARDADAVQLTVRKNQGAHQPN